MDGRYVDEREPSAGPAYAPIHDRLPVVPGNGFREFPLIGSIPNRNADHGPFHRQLVPSDRDVQDLVAAAQNREFHAASTVNGGSTASTVDWRIEVGKGTDREFVGATHPNARINNAPITAVPRPMKQF